VLNGENDGFDTLNRGNTEWRFAVPFDRPFRLLSHWQNTDQ
jgi:hypothetical protein